MFASGAAECCKLPDGIHVGFRCHRNRVLSAGLPLHDARLADDQRIADLLGRLTLDEKVNLMSDHPRISRLGIVFSGQVEGLHGLALGGPGGWGPRGKQPFPHHHLSSGKGPRRDVGPGTAQEDRGLRGMNPATTTRIP
jgi:hypothetical protein